MPSATQLIKRDHRKVESLFDRFNKAKTASAKKKACEQVIQELEVHAKLEEEIFYPAIRKHIGEEECSRKPSRSIKRPRTSWPS